MRVDQSDIDAVVARIKVQVDKHGGNSPKLKAVRDLYTMLHKRSDPATLGLLQGALSELERQ